MALKKARVIVGRTWLAVLALVHRWWQEPIGVVVPLLAATIVLFAPQMPDMWVALQNEQSDAFAPLKFGLAAALLGLTSWYWTRAALFARTNRDDSTTAQRPHAAGKTPGSIALWSANWAPRLSVLVVGVIALLPAYWADRSAAAAVTGAPVLGIVGGVLGVLLVTLLTTLRDLRGWYFGVKAPAWMWRARTTSILAAAPFGWPVALLLLFCGFDASYVVGACPAWIQAHFPAPVAAICALAFVVGPLVLLLGFIRDLLRFLIAGSCRVGCLVTKRQFVRPSRRIVEPFRDALGPILLLVWIYANPFAPNITAYQIRLMDEPAKGKDCSDTSNLRAASVGCRSNLAEALDAWSAIRFADQSKDHPIPVVIVAAEGGASRAAAWLLAAMRYLQDRTEGQFDRHLFAISGVSGGSLGAVTYLQAGARYADGNGVLKWSANPPAYKAAAQLAGEDLLAESIATYFINDVFGRLLGSVWTFDDRAIVLEHAFERYWAEPRGLDLGYERARKGLLDLHRQKPGLPHLLLNGTDRETGRRLITSTIRFDEGDDIFAASEDMLAVLGRDVPAATAVTNSARFPYISPAGHFHRVGQAAAKGDNAVLDGGYFENYGARTASELARAISRNPRYRPIVVVVSNDADARRPIDPVQGSDDIAPLVSQAAIHCRRSTPLTPEQAVLNNRAAGHNVFEFLAPIVGLAAIRGAHGRDALYILQRELCDATYSQASTVQASGSDPKKQIVLRPDRFFHIVLSRPSSETEAAPMNWVLNDRARHFLTETAFRQEADDFNNQQISGLMGTITAIRNETIAIPPR